MSDDIAISVKNVSKAYRIWRDPSARLKAPLWEITGKLLPRWILNLNAKLKLRAGNPARYYKDFYALKEVSFDVKKGEAVGIIGRNGSGKSTLLQMIAGTLTPTDGSIKVNGRVAALLELGSGFNPEFTGRENVYLNASVLGLTKEEIDTRYDQIAGFADIGEFIDQPVKTYSSGMLVRLAFSVQAAVSPDILIIDEALSVGDFFFQQKCLERIRDLQSNGVTIIFVSHDMQTVRDLCQKGVLLVGGGVFFNGENKSAIEKYLGDLNSYTSQKSQRRDGDILGPVEETSARIINSSFWARIEVVEPTCILDVNIIDSSGSKTLGVKIGGIVCIVVRYNDMRNERAHITLSLKNKYNYIVTSLGTYTLGTPAPASKIKPITISFEVALTLEAGEYSLQVTLADETGPSTGNTLDETPWLGPISISWNYQLETPPFFGMCKIPVSAKYI